MRERELNTGADLLAILTLDSHKDSTKISAPRETQLASSNIVQAPEQLFKQRKLVVQ